ncbi:FecR family protein [Labilibacter marinus]|uniref:FecR family protein n=1 Tax=Labilibacter marinus TaxID=1477105 RepID=UPI00082D9221|nr:FecR domain-containing protein [Labilibacter marinus]
MDNTYIENIITKQILEGLEANEQEVLDKWLAESDKNIKDYQAYRKIWNKSKKLVLSDEIDVEVSLKKTKKQIGFKTPKRWLVYARQAAAVLLLSLLISYLYQNRPIDSKIAINEKTIYQEITASYGTRSKLLLSDGTQVWLNSGSTLKFPTAFKQGKKREVLLDGEAFFEVHTDSLRPFIVNTSKLDVKVYGTSFNVSAYNSYRNMTVALTEGKVSLIKDGSLKDEELVVMEPEQVAVFNNKSGKLDCKKDSYIEKHTAWKDGQIIFYGDPIWVVVRRLEKWYNVDIDVADKELNKYRFTATFIDESLEQVLNLLSLSSSMDYKITSARKQDDNSFSKRKITLKVKK